MDETDHGLTPRIPDLKVNRKTNEINDLPTPHPRQCWLCVPPVIALKTRGPLDDGSWVIRYLVVDAGSWLRSRKVLISPYSVMQPDWMHKRLPVRIDRNQVENSPDIDTQKPVSRQHEMGFADYYGYPYYWGGTGFWGDGQYFPVMAPGGGGLRAVEVAKNVAARHATDDPHLRSCNAVIGYHITDKSSNHMRPSIAPWKRPRSA
jgi:hypothetical protein